MLTFFISKLFQIKILEMPQSILSSIKFFFILKMQDVLDRSNKLF